MIVPEIVHGRNCSFTLFPRRLIPGNWVAENGVNRQPIYRFGTTPIADQERAEDDTMGMGGAGSTPSHFPSYERRPYQSATNASKHRPSLLALSTGLLPAIHDRLLAAFTRIREGSFSKTGLPLNPILGNSGAYEEPVSNNAGSSPLPTGF